MNGSCVKNEFDIRYELLNFLTRVVRRGERALEGNTFTTVQCHLYFL